MPTDVLHGSFGLLMLSKYHLLVDLMYPMEECLVGCLALGSKSRKYLVSQTFTSNPTFILTILLGLALSCLLTYFFDNLCTT